MEVALRLQSSFDNFLVNVPSFAQELATGLALQPEEVEVIDVTYDVIAGDLDVVSYLLPLVGDALNVSQVAYIHMLLEKHLLYLKPSLFGNWSLIYIRDPGQVYSTPPPPGTGRAGVPPGPPGASPGGTSKGGGLSAVIIALAVVLPAAAMALAAAGAWYYATRRRRARGEEADRNRRLRRLDDAIVQSPLAGGGGRPGGGPVQMLIAGAAGGESSHSPHAASTPGSRAEASGGGGGGGNPFGGQPQTFSSAALIKATDGFTESNFLGEGGFGRVYRGQLDDGERIAVKVLKDAQGPSKEFTAEVEVLSRLHHRNLVKLLGVCVEPAFRALVYELVPHGSLESHIHGPAADAAPLSWDMRMKVALGAARGLAYLHEGANPRVIHRDFKASNILLETDYTAKVSDFGLAKETMEGDAGGGGAGSGGAGQMPSKHLAGTFGYVAPEYVLTGHVLVKSDVYSYGVVLLELLTGRRPVDFRQQAGQESLVTWATPLLSTREGLERLVDRSLRDSVPFESLSRAAAIASMCIQPEVAHRPFMGEVVQALKLLYNDSDTSESDASGPQGNNFSTEYPPMPIPEHSMSFSSEEMSTMPRLLRMHYENIGYSNSGAPPGSGPEVGNAAYYGTQSALFSGGGGHPPPAFAARDTKSGPAEFMAGTSHYSPYGAGPSRPGGGGASLSDSPPLRPPPAPRRGGGPLQEGEIGLGVAMTPSRSRPKARLPVFGWSKGSSSQDSSLEFAAAGPEHELLTAGDSAGEGYHQLSSP